MSTIENYSSRKARQVQKGTIENPYTEEEYEAMLDAGTWTGGYVEGLGYCGTNVIIDYDSSSSSSSSSDSSDPEGSEDEPSDDSPLIDPNDNSDSTENDEGAGGNGNAGGNTNSGTGTGGSGSDGTSTGGGSSNCLTTTQAANLVSIARRYLGYNESANADQVVRWLMETGCPNATASTPWCAAFVYCMFKKAGLTGYKSAAVSAWKSNWGITVSTPHIGDVAFFTAWSHMGIVTSVNGNMVTVISGNYTNSVQEETKDASKYTFKRGK